MLHRHLSLRWHVGTIAPVPPAGQSPCATTTAPPPHSPPAARPRRLPPRRMADSHSCHATLATTATPRLASRRRRSLFTCWPPTHRHIRARRRPAPLRRCRSAATAISHASPMPPPQLIAAANVGLRFRRPRRQTPQPRSPPSHRSFVASPRLIRRGADPVPASADLADLRFFASFHHGLARAGTMVVAARSSPSPCRSVGFASHSLKRR